MLSSRNDGMGKITIEADERVLFALAHAVEDRAIEHESANQEELASELRRLRVQFEKAAMEKDT